MSMSKSPFVSGVFLACFLGFVSCDQVSFDGHDPGAAATPAPPEDLTPLTNVTKSELNSEKNDYQDLFKVLNIGIANTLRNIQRSPFYNLAPNMFLIKNNLTDDDLTPHSGVPDPEEGEEPVTHVVSLVQLIKSTDSLFKSHSLFCLLSDKNGLQIARAPGNEELGIRIKKVDDRFQNEIQEGRGRHDIAFLPIMYAMGVIMTMLGVITFLTIKSITIGVILLVVAYTYTLGKLKHHKKFLYHYPEHYHHHHPHYHHGGHGHKGYAIDVLQHDILHDYEHEFPLSPHAAETAYHVDAPNYAYQDAQPAGSSPTQDTRKAYSQAGWAYVLVDKVPDKMSHFTQKRGVVAKKKRKVSHLQKKISSLG